MVVRDGGGGWSEMLLFWGGNGGIFLPGEENKKYEIRTKMEQEQWLQLKMLFRLGYNLKIVI